MEKKIEIYKVLLLEDDLKSAEITVRILEKFNFQIDHVNDARLAISKIKNKYDLIITDIMMPIMDGFSFIEKNQENLKDTPILILSSLKDKENILKAASLKITKYLSKPFDSDTLIAKVCETLKIQVDDLILKKDILFDILYETISEGNLKLTIKGILIEQNFATKLEELVTRIQTFSKKLKSITLIVSEEFYNSLNSVLLIEDLLNEFIKKFSIQEESILLRGDFFSKVTEEEISKNKILKSLIKKK